MHAAARAGLHGSRDDVDAGRVAARRSGIDELVDDGRDEWEARAHVGDLEALRHRSRVTEAAALTDPAGLGAHRVLVFTKRERHGDPGSLTAARDDRGFG